MCPSISLSWTHRNDLPRSVDEYHTSMVHIRPSSVFLVFISFCVLIFVSLLFVHPFLARESYRQNLAVNQKIVRDLQLTDLCLFTEARYTRHLSQADIHSAFQDHPTALEYFPSGSTLSPPKALWGRTP